MYKQFIKKGCHRPSPFKIAAFDPIFLFNKKDFEKTFTKYVTFGAHTYYNIGQDQSDWNKLYGVCLGIRGPHGTSFRFGWRYIEDNDSIEICAYYYCNGVGWTAQPLCYVGRQNNIRFDLKLKSKNGAMMVVFTVTEMLTKKTYRYVLNCALFSNPRLGFGCGLYFGGNRRAPKDMEFVFMDSRTLIDEKP